MTSFTQEIRTSFGSIYVFQSHETGRMHASGFGVEAESIADLVSKCEALYYAHMPEPSNVEYQQQYAYACGYWE